MAEFHVKVENVVAFASLGKDIPLTRLIAKIENAEYEPEQFPGLVYRTLDPRAAALIFSSGKIVCTGAKSIEMAKIAMRKVVDRVRQTGIDLPTKFNVQVENIVASSKIRANLNLEEIAFALENAEYEPEQFPGLVYRINDPRVAFLLFSSGKIICTGAHNIEDIHNALSKLKRKLEEIGIKVTPIKDGPVSDRDAPLPAKSADQKEEVKIEEGGEPSENELEEDIEETEEEVLEKPGLASKTETGKKVAKPPSGKKQLKPAKARKAPKKPKKLKKKAEAKKRKPAKKKAAKARKKAAKAKKSVKAKKPAKKAKHKKPAKKGRKGKKR